MLFNSYSFIFLFLPVALIGFFAIAQSKRHGVNNAAIWLGIVSIVFYSIWSIKYVPLLLISIGFNYLVGRWISKSRNSSQRYAFTGLVIGIGVNLALLAYFKYFNFFIDSINETFQVGISWSAIVLPIGISFFTFTQIAFLVDVYKGIAAEYRFSHYLLFVTYFPHLIAGPVLHHKQMMPQFSKAETYHLQTNYIAMGLTWFTMGLSKKVLLADNLASFADPVFSYADYGIKLGFLESWTGAIAYSLQLYFDFSGYSDMAIGLSLLFGVRLPLNFHSPYKSSSMIDFWRRWHMTLSQFLKDYLYIPLGGNKKGSVRRYLNLMITMLLGGLWHGAGWTYVIWGGIHGLYLMINHFWRSLAPKLRLRSQDRGAWLAITCTILTFSAVVLAWVMFRSTTTVGALAMYQSMSFANGLVVVPELASEQSTIWLAIGLCIVFLLPNTQEIMEHREESRRIIAWKPSIAWALGTALLFATCVLNLSKFSPFIYFQF